MQKKGNEYLSNRRTIGQNSVSSLTFKCGWKKLQLLVRHFLPFTISHRLPVYIPSPALRIFWWYQYLLFGPFGQHFNENICNIAKSSYFSFIFYEQNRFNFVKKLLIVAFPLKSVLFIKVRRMSILSLKYTLLGQNRLKIGFQVWM